MTTLDFPSSPYIGQEYSANGSRWVWDETETAWVEVLQK
jgi:hypothetical protein